MADIKDPKSIFILTKDNRLEEFLDNGITSYFVDFLKNNKSIIKKILIEPRHIFLMELVNFPDDTWIILQEPRENLFPIIPKRLNGYIIYPSDRAVNMKYHNKVYFGNVSFVVGKTFEHDVPNKFDNIKRIKELKGKKNIFWYGRDGQHRGRIIKEIEEKGYNVIRGKIDFSKENLFDKLVENDCFCSLSIDGGSWGCYRDFELAYYGIPCIKISHGHDFCDLSYDDGFYCADRSRIESIVNAIEMCKTEVNLGNATRLKRAKKYAEGLYKIVGKVRGLLFFIDAVIRDHNVLKNLILHDNIPEDKNAMKEFILNFNNWLPSKMIEQRKEGLPEEAIKIIKKTAKNNEIILTYAGLFDSGHFNSKELRETRNYYLSQAINWICAMERLKITNYIIICLDTYTFNHLKKFTKNLYLDEKINVTQKRYLWEKRMIAVDQLLEIGYNVILSDLDAIWKEDPHKSILDNKDDIVCEVIFVPLGSQPRRPQMLLNDKRSIMLCPGFILIRNSNKTKRFWKEKVLGLHMSDDQDSLIHAVKNANPKEILNHDKEIKIEINGMTVHAYQLRERNFAVQHGRFSVPRMISNAKTINDLKNCKRVFLTENALQTLKKILKKKSNNVTTAQNSPLKTILKKVKNKLFQNQSKLLNKLTPRPFFIHIPKNGGTSIRNACKNKIFSPQGHWTYNQTIEKMKNQKLRPGFSFAVVRNPWARLVSAYEYARMPKSHWHNNIKGKRPNLDYETLKNKSFKEFLKMLKSGHKFWHPSIKHDQAHYIANSKGDILVDYVLRHETLDEDFEKIKKKLRITNELKRLNSNNHKHYTEYYDDELKKVVAKIYKRDIELFKYEFKNDNKKEFLIHHGRPMAGLFSHIITLLKLMSYIRQLDHHPIVIPYWSDDCPYWNKDGYHDKKNVFEYYFEPIEGHTISEALPIKINDDIEITKKDLKKESRRFRKDLSKQIRKGDLTRIKFDKTNNFPDNVSFLSLVQQLPHFNNKRINQLDIKKYIKPRQYIKDKISKFNDKFMKGYHVIGLHIRGPGHYECENPLGKLGYKYTKNGKLENVPFKEYFAIVDRHMKKFPNSKILIASDDSRVIEKVKERYGNKVISYDANRFKGGEGHLMGKNNPAFKTISKAVLGEDVLIEALLLSKCDCFVYGKSNIAHAVILWSPNMQCYNVFDSNESKSQSNIMITTDVTCCRTGHQQIHRDTAFMLAELFNLTYVHFPINIKGRGYEKHSKDSEEFFGLAKNNITKHDIEDDDIQKLTLGGNRFGNQYDKEINWNGFDKIKTLLEKCNDPKKKYLITVHNGFFFSSLDFDKNGKTPFILEECKRTSNSLKKRFYRANINRELYFEKDTLNIAVHIRKGDIAPANHPDHWKYLTDSYFIDKIKKIVSIIKNKIKYKIHVYTGPNSVLHKDIETRKDVEVHRGGVDDIFDDMYHMACADILILSKSFFSLVAAERSNGVLVTWDDFNKDAIIEYVKEKK